MKGNFEISSDQVKETEKVKEKSFKMSKKIKRTEEAGPGHNSGPPTQQTSTHYLGSI